MIAQNPKTFGGFLLGQFILSTVSDVFHSKGGTGFATLILSILIAVAVHLTVIKGQRELTGLQTKVLFGGYVGRILVFMATSLALGFFAASLVGTQGRAALILVALPLVGIVYGLLLSAFGTCLPAVAVGGDASFLEARRRGKHVFGYTAIRLFFCLGPAAALSFFSLFELVYYLSESGLLKEGQFFSLANVGVILFSSALGAFNTALTSTILSRAYLIGEDKRWEATARGPALSLA